MNEPSQLTSRVMSSYGVELTPAALREVEHLIAQGYSRQAAELAVIETTEDKIGYDPPPPIPWDDPVVAAILEADTASQYDSDEAAAAAVREKSAHLTPAELAEFICKAQGEPLIPVFVEGFFRDAFPAIPKEALKSVRTWSRYGGKPGTLTDAEFNAILQPYIGPSAKPAP